MIKLSLILPVYNVSNYIERCLNSICKQNNKYIEIIIINDGSLDDSIKKATKYSTVYKNIRIINQENRGLGGARNTGLRHAKGEYVWFIDSDDEISQDSISYIMQNIHGEEIIIYDYNKLNKNGEIIGSSFYEKEYSHISGPEATNKFILGQAWRSLYKRSFLIKNNIFFREHFLHEDGEFNMRAMCFANNVSYKSQIIYRYYTSNNESIMNNIRIKNIEDLLLYIDTMYQIKDQYPDLTSNQNKLLTRYVLLSLNVLFCNVTRLQKEDLYKYKKIIKKNRNKIIKAINFKYLKISDILKIYLQIYITYRWVYNIIYFKHF